MKTARDPGTPERSSQDKDPRTFEENSQGGDLSAPGEIWYTGRSQERFIQLSKSTSNGRGCTRGGFVSGNGMRKTFCKTKRKRNSQGKDQKTFDENSQGGNLSTLKRSRQGEDPRTLKEHSQGGDLSTPETNRQGKDPRTFREPVERRRVQKKQMEEKWKKKKNKKKKKKVKYRRRSWWKKCKEKIVGLISERMKEEKKVKEGRKRNRRPRARQVLGKSGRWLFLFLLLVQTWLCVNAAAEGLQKRTEMMNIWQQQEVRVKESRWAEEIPQRWKQPKGEDRTEMKKEAKMLRCTLLNGSAWSTERKYMRRYKGRCDIFFGIEHRLRKE